MDMMRVLVATIRHRQYGPALVAQLKALKHLADTDSVRVQHLDLYSYPLTEGETVYDQICNQYNTARSIALDSECDVLITLEDDMVPPADGFSRLLRVLFDERNPADVASGLYCFRHGWKHRWSAFIDLNDDSGVSLSDDDTAMRGVWGRVIPVDGLGLGFTAIRKRVLADVAFERRGEAANDWYFALDCIEQGFVHRCDTGCLVGHMTMSPTPRIIYPTLDPTEIYREELLDVPEENLI